VQEKAAQLARQRVAQQRVQRLVEQGVPRASEVAFAVQTGLRDRHVVGA
jgi:hypothetical protein